MASGSGRALYERSFHAHRAGELLSFERHRTADAVRDQIGCNGENRHCKAGGYTVAKRSLDAVKAAHANVKPDDLQRKVKVAKRDATVDGMYLRIIVHANEHMGQLVAYARMNGVVPPWSESGK
jgi:hypothetical protein